jgi:hypothetical protein
MTDEFPRKKKGASVGSDTGIRLADTTCCEGSPAGAGKAMLVKSLRDKQITVATDVVNYPDLFTFPDPRPPSQESGQR